MKRAILSALIFVFSACVGLADPPPTSETDIATMQTITLAPVQWTYSPGPADPKLTAQPLQLPAGKLGNHPGPGGRDFIVPSGDSLLAYQDSVGQQKVNNKRVDLFDLNIVDLKSGTSRDPIHLPPGLTAKAITSDGAVAVLSTASSFDPDSSQVQIMDLTAGTIRLAFMPYEGEDKFARYVEWARMLDKDHLLTLNEGGGRDQKLMLWQLTEGSVKAIWDLKVTHHFGGDPVLTPDSKYVLVNDMTGTYFIDAHSGKIAGSMCDASSGSWFVNQGLKFTLRPDGMMLARSTDVQIKVLSLTPEPKEIASISMPPKLKASSVVWVGNDYLMVNRSYLVDISKGMIIWKYTGLGGEGRGDGALLAGDGRVWQLTVDRKVGLTALSLPDDHVKQTIAGLNMDQIMAIKPGMKVSLHIEIPDQTLADSLQSHFESELKKNDMTIADDQPIKLHVKMGTFGTETVGYHDVRRSRLAPADNVDVTKKQMSVAYELSGERLWETVLYAGTPLMVSIKPGQSLSGAIAQEQQGTWKQIDNLELPKFVPAHRDEPGFGQTAMDETKR